ncbi:hypothetical protein R9208_25595 [Flammeovirgaceae bacterium SG7u.132]|nr:hypothetical protein [Flammeovirgaceae bacterium SG7u.132]
MKKIVRNNSLEKLKHFLLCISILTFLAHTQSVHAETSSSLVPLGVEPAYSATSFVVDGASSGFIDFSFAAASDYPDAYLVLRRTSATPTAPLDGVTYSTGTQFSGQLVISTSSATSISTDGLKPGETYYFDIYPYNGSGITTNYKQSSPLTATVTTVLPPK